jgi:hypothetical protein
MLDRADDPQRPRLHAQPRVLRLWRLQKKRHNRDAVPLGIREIALGPREAPVDNRAAVRERDSPKLVDVELQAEAPHPQNVERINRRHEIIQIERHTRA